MAAKKPTQIKLFKDQPKAYGGSLLKTRKGRSQGRSLSTKHSMHLVLKSSLAKGKWSFRYQSHPIRVKKIIQRFAKKYGIAIHSMANVGNHLHMQIKLGNRYSYRPFIRAITSAITMMITGRNRWSRGNIKTETLAKTSKKFWDYRPFSRVVIGYRALLSLNDYLEINKMEGEGIHRNDARMIISSKNRLGILCGSTA